MNALRAALVLVPTILIAAGAAAPAATAADVPLPAGSVTMTVEDVTPNTPLPSSTPKQLTVVLTLHNNSSQLLDGVAVSAERGDPINSEAALKSAIAKPRRPSPGLVAPVATDPVAVTLLPGATADIVFRTTTDIPFDAAICLCHDSIYPLYFSAIRTVDGVASTLAVAQTYIPVFGKTTPQPLTVGWVWPLLDRPHRLADDNLFVDDLLARQLAPGGRLDRWLQVLERVADKVPMTLVIDPDLVDEIAVMAAGPYQVRNTNDAKTHAGAGTSAAKDWLSRLRAVLDAAPDLELDFTAFADPDVESLTRNNLPWSAGVRDQAAQGRITEALGGRTPLGDIAWPVGGSLSQPTLATLVSQGVQTVIVSDQTLPGGPRGPANDLSPLQSASGPAIAGVTSADLEDSINEVLDPGGRGLAALPELVSQIALRSIESLDTTHYVLLTPRRRVNPDPMIAERAILATAHTFWSRPLPLRAAARTVVGVDRGGLRPGRGGPQLPAQTVGAIEYITASLPGLTGSDGLFPAAAPPEIDALPAGTQRAASAELLSEPQRSVTDATTLADQVQALRERDVVLVKPANGSYTLTSTNSSLPVTVRNTLAVPVQVVVTVTPVNGVPGFRATPERVTLDPASTVQVRIATHVERTGRLDVTLGLTTPNSMPLGLPVQVSVRSTALGTIGIAITTGAAIVLVLALLLRGLRALRWRRRRKAGLRPPVTDPLAP